MAFILRVTFGISFLRGSGEYVAEHFGSEFFGEGVLLGGMVGAE